MKVQLVPVTKNHTKEAEEIAVAVKGLVESALKANSDGFQPVTDITAVVMENFGKLQEALAGASEVGTEFKEEQSAFIRTFANMGLDISDMVKAPKASEVQA